MRPVQLRKEASAGLLLADLFVLWFAVGLALDADAPVWLRLGSAAVAALALSLAVRSLMLLRRQQG